MSKPDWAERLQRTFQRRFEAGQQFEHERIIKLLEKANSSKTHSVSNGCGLCQAIALIKGENK